MTIKKADQHILMLGLPVMNAGKMRSYSKIGQFIEQEGEHNIARTILARVYSHLEKLLDDCEQTLAEATDPEVRAELIKRRLLILAEMNSSARNLAATRGKVEARTEDSPPPVPTMPARTEITNNTQIVVQAPSKA